MSWDSSDLDSLSIQRSAVRLVVGQRAKLCVEVKVELGAKLMWIYPPVKPVIPESQIKSIWYVGVTWDPSTVRTYDSDISVLV